jgi:hypothetical protein
MKTALLLAALLLVASSSQAATLTLKDGAPMTVPPDDCEGRPCGPNASINFQAEGGFNCTAFISEWSRLNEDKGIYTSKGELIADLSRIDTYAGSSPSKHTCIEHHPEDASLCTLERTDYTFSTSFSSRSGLYISCAKNEEHRFNKVTTADALRILSTIQSPWLFFTP